MANEKKKVIFLGEHTTKIEKPPKVEMANRPELREKLIEFEYCYQWCGETAYACKKQNTCPAFQDKDGTPFNLASHSIAKAKADHNLALIPDIEEAREQLRVQVPNLIAEAKKQERERMLANLKAHLTRVSSEGIAFYFNTEDWRVLKENDGG